MEKMDLIKSIKFTPELLGVTPLEFNKIEKRIEKILAYLSELFPNTMYYLKSENYEEEFYPILDTITHFLEKHIMGDKKNTNYKNFPWKKEIRKRLHEKYGFQLH